MNDNENDALGFNRRDFLKGGSLATVMTMLGGVEMLAQTNAPAAGETKTAKPKMKVAVIGLGARGREIVSTLARARGSGHRGSLRYLSRFPEAHRQHRAFGDADSRLQDYSGEQGHPGGHHCDAHR